MTETLADSRCPLCGWVGCAGSPVCPRCGYGLVEYEVVFDD